MVPFSPRALRPAAASDTVVSTMSLSRGQPWCIALAAAWILTADPGLADPPQRPPPARRRGPTRPRRAPPRPPPAVPAQELAWDAAQRCRDVETTEIEANECIVRAISECARQGNERCRALLEVTLRVVRSLRPQPRPPPVRPDAPALPPNLSQAVTRARRVVASAP